MMKKHCISKSKSTNNRKYRNRHTAKNKNNNAEQTFVNMNFYIHNKTKEAFISVAAMRKNIECQYTVYIKLQ